MAGEDRAQIHALELLESIQQEPYRYGFFRALRRIECSRADRPRIGQAQRLSDEVIRLGQEPSLAFAPSSLASLDLGEGDAPARLSVFFLGLFGPNGPLPLHLSEYARDRERNNSDSSFARFADVFHHRILSLFYRAWADSQPALSYDRPQDDRFARQLASMFGQGSPELLDRDSISDLVRLHHAGLMSLTTRPAEGLLQLVSSYFGLPVEIEEFVGQWIDLPPDTLLELGSNPAAGRLGESTTIGARIWDCQQKFRIVLGPMGRDDYQRLLPGSTARRRLVDLVRGYLGDELDWDLRLILKKDDVPGLKLGGTNRLGWSTWLRSGPATKDASDLVLNLLADGLNAEPA